MVGSLYTVVAEGKSFDLHIACDENGVFVARSKTLPDLFLMEDSAATIVVKAPAVIESILRAQRGPAN